MDDDALNMRNWGYYEPTFKGHLGLQLMTSMADRDTKPFLSGRDPNSVMVNGGGGGGGPYHHPRDCVVSSDSGPPPPQPQPPTVVPINYSRDNPTWASQREKLLNMLPPNNHHNHHHHYNNSNIIPDPASSAPGPHQMQMLHQPDPSRGNEDEDSPPPSGDKQQPQTGGTSKKRGGGGGAHRAPKVKKPRKPRESNGNGSSGSGVPRLKAPKKSLEVVINGIDMDISGIPIPVCSCTGAPQQCYRWGCGGWQSACCTTNVSVYPLPMSTKRRGARIAGRKMSQGAFKKVLEKLAAEGYNFANPIDLRTHWARHGTNKFVTIR